MVPTQATKALGRKAGRRRVGGRGGGANEDFLKGGKMDGGV